MPGRAETDDVTWGLGDAALGFVLAYVLTVVFTPLIFAITGVASGTEPDDLPLRTIALLQIPFSGGMLGVTLIASFYKGRGPITDFGLRMRWTDGPLGVVLGATTQFAAFALYLPFIWLDLITTDDIAEPARELTDKAHGGGVVLLILVVAIAAPVVEEIFFRGLLLRSLERRYGTSWAVVGSSALFGAAHFEQLQFPALFLFGLVAAYLATRTGRLGPGIWAHLAFNSVAVVQLVR